MKYIEVIQDITTMHNRDALDFIGDLGGAHFIVHGCNCEYIRGAGLAIQMAEKFDANLYEMEIPTPGNISVFPISDVCMGINAYIQEKPGPHGEYMAIVRCLKKINFLAKNRVVAFPAIGCVTGGLDWPVVKALIKEYMYSAKEVVVCFLDEKEKRKLEQ